MKRILMLAAVAAASFAVGAAQAQTAPAADPVAPENLALARQLMEVSGGREQVDKTLDAMFVGMDKMLASVMPAGEQKLTISFQADLGQEMKAMAPDLIEITARAYAKNLTTKELQDMIAWQSTESARSIRAKVPAILQQVLVEEGPLIKRMMPSLMQKAFDHACDQSHCTAEDRQMIAKVISRVTAS